MKQLLTFLLLAYTSGLYAQTKDELFLRDTAMIAAELAEMRHADQKNGRRGNTDEVDKRNTERLIEIINTYGFPSPSRFGFKGNAGVILIHTPPIYYDTVQILIDNEKAAGRMSNNEHAYINWHINGRLGMPAFDSTSGIKMIDRHRKRNKKG
ncbi:MAG TPA: hypothetical protein VGD89_11055 [Flavipsychrobacter sp.]